VSCAGSISGEKLSATVNNAMCGDRITLDFAVDPTHEIYECRHDTKACVLTQASASILAAHAIGETGESLAHIREKIARMLKEGVDAPSGKWSVFAIFAPVREHKSRHTCVLLPFEAAEKAFTQK
jgi:nitrogen fixation NifU-like protein